MKLFARSFRENLRSKHRPISSVASIDTDFRDLYQSDLDKLADDVYTAITSVDDSQDRRLDQAYFRFVSEVGSMESSIEGMHKEIKAIRDSLQADLRP
ncbi:hypothetical protein Bca52824_000891 [Brassica carinata]|uniref:Uncharacterized protein n=1 Tax=Brassica carinata TaxID=52824 RepID=A0A8X7WHQ2_BRACI|nr:hypothetical protein Bca52824_000891 [Brassica carinata]